MGRIIPIEKLKEVQRRCRELDDEPRWLLALITESGMRLSEAIGLSKDDVKLEVPIPHICLKSHK
jgi:integrase